MEELVGILITLIGRWLKSDARKPAPRGNAPPPIPGVIKKRAEKIVRVDPSNRAVVTANMPTARRIPGRRPKPPAIAIARPIVTNTAPVPPVIAPVAPMKAVATKPLEAASKTTKVPLSAPAIRGWLNPTTLQQQFVLTEIFQPPIALRGSKHW